MTRVDRLIGILSFAVAVALLFGLMALAGASIGPLELLGIVIVAIPIAMLLFRLGRQATGARRQT